MTHNSPSAHPNKLGQDKLGHNKLDQAKKLVIKIGSALLMSDQPGFIRHAWLEVLLQEVAAAQKSGQEVIIVSSGAIALGRRQLGLIQGKLKLEEKQAAASIGQIRLSSLYQEMLAKHQIIASQILLTLEDTEDRQRHLNARNTINTLLKFGVIPVINENDTVATAEIRFGDNDRLAARVAAMMGADVLVLLSDIDGLYTADPRKNPQATFVPMVTKVTEEIENMAGKPPVGYSSGGMITKIAAARIAMAGGCSMVIANGKELAPLSHIQNGGRCTWFIPTSEMKKAKKTWIAGSLNPSGQMVIDPGAVQAIYNGKSLLPAGVVEVRGNFKRGDLVAIMDQSNHEIARGLSAYATQEIASIKGRKTTDIAGILGYEGQEEIIHRDDMALVDG